LDAPAVIVEMHERKLRLHRLVPVLRAIDKNLRQAHPVSASVNASGEFGALIGAAA